MSWRCAELDPVLCSVIVASDKWKVVQGEGDCLLWDRPINNQGYGVISVQGWMRYAHRIALVAHLGRDFPELVVDHLCRTPRCVNPEHLEAVPHRVNAARGLAARREICARGHAFDEVNTYIRPDTGSQACRQCKRENDRAYKAERRETAAWRCAWDMHWMPGTQVYCTHCGRDIMHPGPEEKPRPGRPRLPDGDGNEERRERDRLRKARKKAEARA